MSIEIDESSILEALVECNPGKNAAAITMNDDSGLDYYTNYSSALNKSVPEDNDGDESDEEMRVDVTELASALDCGVGLDQPNGDLLELRGADESRKIADCKAMLLSSALHNVVAGFNYPKILPTAKSSHRRA